MGECATSERCVVTIDGVEAGAETGNTILDLAREQGIAIPTLCHDPRLKPYGACRLCLVEVEGARGPVPACTTALTPGMVIRTNTEPIREMRRNIIDLLLSDHPSDCLACEASGDCKLQEYAYEYGVRESSLADAARHPVRPQEPDLFIARDMSKCILCGACVRICSEVTGARAIGMSHRGFETQVSTPNGVSLADTTCVFCGQCVSACPVGALTEAQALGQARSWETTKTKTICPYCGTGCTLEVHTKNNKVVKITSPVGEGVNDGNLCVKGRFAYEFINSPDRLNKPLIKRDGTFIEVEWDEAISFVAQRFAEIKAEHGPDALGVLTSSRGLNEENYVAQKFYRSIIGTNSVDNCARVCHAPTVAGLSRAFGSGAATNPLPDIGKTDLLFVIGSNTTEAHPVVGMMVTQAVAAGTKLIVADPRKIDLAPLADQWLRLKAGTNVALLNGMLNVIVNEDLSDDDFIRNRTEGFEPMWAVVASYTPEKVEQITGVPADDVRAAARAYASAKSALIIYSLGVTEHRTGSQGVMCLANLAMATGNVGREGAGIAVLRGQNNVQGSCDMGALPEYYTGYQRVSDEAARKRFGEAWDVELSAVPGLKEPEMYRAAIAGKFKSLHVIGYDPAKTQANLGFVHEGFDNMDFVVVQDLFLTETAKRADVVLPVACYFEKDGTFTNADRRIQPVHRVVEAPEGLKSDWEVVCDIAKAMGADFDYGSSEEILEEVAELTPQYHGVTLERIETETLHWPVFDLDHPGTPMMHSGKFAKGLGTFHDIPYLPSAELPDDDYPLLLSTGRILQHYCNGSMTMRSPIGELVPETLLEVHPIDAEHYGLTDGGFVTLESRRGEVRIRVKVTERSRPGSVWTSFHNDEPLVNLVTGPGEDSFVLTPEYKVCAVRVTPS